MKRLPFFLASLFFLVSCSSYNATTDPVSTSHISSGEHTKLSKIIIRRLHKLAEQGDATAQYNLGVIYDIMYDNGDGVQQDITESVKWFRKAAEQGYAEAQYFLGVNYFGGDGVPQDFVEAYAWSNIAAAQGVSNAIEIREICKNILDNISLANAQERSQKYFEKYVEPFRVNRRRRRDIKTSQKVELT